jgi:hypothetical protein
MTERLHGISERLLNIRHRLHKTTKRLPVPRRSKAPAVPTDRYIHEPLDLQKDQIRLLRIEGRHDGVIHCALQNYDFHNCPAYDALSYVWGPETPTHTIRLNGRPFNIRENLWHFLDQAVTGFSCMDESYRPDVFWIDQISIDQSAALERNHQVQHMASIYTRATRVIAWLGQGDPVCDGTMRTIAMFNWQQDPIRAETSADELLKRREWSIFRKPYWGRLWIVQEFVMPECLYILCGPFYVQWSHVKGMLDLDSSLNLPSNAFFLLRCRQERHDTHVPSTLSDLLDTLSDFECTDLRDKIYGLLALPEDDHGISVDYTLAAGDVFWQAASSLIMKGNADSRDADWVQLGLSMGVDGTERSLRDPGMKQFCRDIFQLRFTESIPQGIRRVRQAIEEGPGDSGVSWAFE